MMKNETGQHKEIKAEVLSLDYDWAEKFGGIYAVGTVDMDGTIAFFKRIDPQVSQIQTYNEGVSDVAYILVGGEWVARL